MAGVISNTSHTHNNVTSANALMSEGRNTGIRFMSA